MRETLYKSTIVSTNKRYFSQLLRDLSLDTIFSINKEA